MKKKKLFRVSGGDINMNFGKGSYIDAPNTILIDNGESTVTNNVTKINNTQKKDIVVNLNASIF